MCAGDKQLQRTHFSSVGVVHCLGKFFLKRNHRRKGFHRSVWSVSRAKIFYRDPQPAVIRAFVQVRHHQLHLTRAERDTSVSGISFRENTVPFSRAFSRILLLVSRNPFSSSLRSAWSRQASSCNAVERASTGEVGRSCTEMSLAHLVTDNAAHADFARVVPKPDGDLVKPAWPQRERIVSGECKCRPNCSPDRGHPTTVSLPLVFVPWRGHAYARES